MLKPFVVMLSLAAGVFAQESAPIHYRYGDGCKQATASGKAIIVWVGCRPRHDTPGAITATADVLEGYPAQCVVVADANLNWKATLPLNATLADVSRVLNPPVEIRRFASWAANCST